MDDPLEQTRLSLGLPEGTPANEIIEKGVEVEKLMAALRKKGAGGAASETNEKDAAALAARVEMATLAGRALQRDAFGTGADQAMEARAFKAAIETPLDFALHAKSYPQLREKIVAFASQQYDFYGGARALLCSRVAWVNGHVTEAGYAGMTPAEVKAKGLA